MDLSVAHSCHYRNKQAVTPRLPVVRKMGGHVCRSRRNILDSIHFGQLLVTQISQSDKLDLFKVITHTLFMSIAFIILFFALLIWIKAFIHDKISRFVLLSFVAYWCFALFSSTLSPLGLFPISNSTYGIMTLGVLSFVFGMSIVGTNSEMKLSTYDLTQIKTIFDKTLSSRILICVYIIFTLIALKYSTKALIVSALQESASEWSPNVKS